jgi:prefoldin subunit 5
MSKTLLSTMQVIASEIERLQVRLELCLSEAKELQSAIKTLQKVNAKKEKKAEKKTVVIDQIHSQKEV